MAGDVAEAEDASPGQLLQDMPAATVIQSGHRVRAAGSRQIAQRNVDETRRILHAASSEALMLEQLARVARKREQCAARDHTAAVEFSNGLA